MKNDVKALKEAWNDSEVDSWVLVHVGFMILLSSVLAMVWRVIMGLVTIIVGTLKLFKPRQHSRILSTQFGKQEKCPKCGTEMTYYNHFAFEDEEGISYVKCNCGYDSRND